MISFCSDIVKGLLILIFIKLVSGMLSIMYYYGISLRKSSKFFKRKKYRVVSLIVEDYVGLMKKVLVLSF